jgi:type I restriction enzyme S subunit
MIEDLKPYPETKDSGLAWLGEIPAHWVIKRNGSLFQQRNAVGEPDWPILEVSLRTGVRIREFGSSKRKQVMSDKAKYKCATEGDYVYNMMRMWQGAAGIAPVDGLVSPAYVVAKPLPHVNPGYFASLFRTDDYLAEIDAFSRGIVKDRNRLYWDQFKQIPTPCPPTEEQNAIVRFLAWAINRLDRAIRAKRRIIALLNEQKQAIIHRAVTRGLDPNVRLKPSGVDWLGDVPEHWRIVRNMALFAHRVEHGAADLPVLQVSLRSGITAEDLDQFGRPKRLIADPAKYKRIHKDDIAYNTMRMWQGAVGVSPSDGLVSPAYVVLIPRAGTSPDFYDLVFHTDIYKQQVNRQSTGIVSDRNRLYWESFKQMANIALARSEQETILAFIRSETCGLSATSSRLEREIKLLHEYRTRLIADVVTGKLDVRQVAAGLPEAIEPLHAGDTGDEVEEIEPGEEEET